MKLSPAPDRDVFQSRGGSCCWRPVLAPADRAAASLRSQLRDESRPCRSHEHGWLPKQCRILACEPWLRRGSPPAHGPAAETPAWLLVWQRSPWSRGSWLAALSQKCLPAALGDSASTDCVVADHDRERVAP